MEAVHQEEYESAQSPRTRSYTVSHLLLRKGITSAGVSQCLGQGAFSFVHCLCVCDFLLTSCSVRVANGAESETSAL